MKLIRLTIAQLCTTVALGSMIACATDAPTDAGEPSSEATAGARVDHPRVAVRTYDDGLVALNDRLPGFGGMWFDEAGAPQVHLTDAGAPAMVVAELAAYFDSNGARGAGQEMAQRARIYPARYEFGELSGWHRAFKAAGIPRGVTMLDVDDRENRFTIGIETQAFEDEVWVAVDEVGVPREAVTIEIVERPQLMQSLDQLYTPRIAGLQINTTNGGVRDSACTLGFLGIRPFDQAMFVVTASHCTFVPWSVTGDWFGQPFLSDTIGYEVADPPLFDHVADSGCPVYNPRTNLPVRCRYSDAAAILATHHINPSWHGTIAGTVFSSLVIQDSWTITSLTGVGVNWQVTKVGRTTGTSYGLIRRACADVWHSVGTFEDVFLLCQSAASVEGGLGDSGGPVFANDPFPTGYGEYRPVMLQGLYWGRALRTTGPVGSFEPYQWYSSTWQILDELRPYLGSYLNPMRHLYP